MPVSKVSVTDDQHFVDETTLTDATEDQSIAVCETSQAAISADTYEDNEDIPFGSDHCCKL